MVKASETWGIQVDGGSKWVDRENSKDGLTIIPKTKVFYERE